MALSYWLCLSNILIPYKNVASILKNIVISFAKLVTSRSEVLYDVSNEVFLQYIVLCTHNVYMEKTVLILLRKKS